MPMKHSMNNLSPLACAVPDAFWVVLRAEANGTSAPDGADPTNGITWGRTDVGLLTVTFAADEKPRRVLFGIGQFEETDVDAHIVYTGYTAATGVVTLSTLLETAGVPAVNDFTDKTITLALLCTLRQGNDA